MVGTRIPIAAMNRDVRLARSKQNLNGSGAMEKRRSLNRWSTTRALLKEGGGGIVRWCEGVVRGWRWGGVRRISIQ